MNDPLESDWKKFRAMLPVWRERYLAERNVRIVAALTAEGKSQTVRFWDGDELIRKEARVLQQCFDDIRRSRMLERLWAMHGSGVIRREDLAAFSQDLQSKVFHEWSN